MADGFIANENGNIKISEEVVVRISSISARDVEGVTMLGTPASSLSELWSKKNQVKGVKADLTEAGAQVDIHISVRFGCKIYDVARKVQESVRFALESYVGLNNAMVNVFVDSIDSEKQAPEKAAFEEQDDAPETAPEKEQQN